MATIRERISANGTLAYHVQVRCKGYPTQAAGFKRLNDARRWAQLTEADMREERHFLGAAAKRHTMADLIERYRQTILPHKSRNTIGIQRPHLNCWQDRIGHMRLSDVTTAVIAEQRDLLSKAFNGRYEFANRVLGLFTTWQVMTQTGMVEE